MIVISALQASTTDEVMLCLARNGISMPIKDLVSGISGTVFLAISSGVPFPGFTVGLPATPPVDRLMAAALAQMLVTLRRQ